MVCVCRRCGETGSLPRILVRNCLSKWLHVGLKKKRKGSIQTDHKVRVCEEWQWMEPAVDHVTS
jgi:hypothetical protein